MDAVERFGNFDLIKKVKLDFTDVVVSKWKSRVTGLNVIHLDYEGVFCQFREEPATSLVILAPIVNGYFVVPTESASPRHFESGCLRDVTSFR